VSAPRPWSVLYDGKVARHKHRSLRDAVFCALYVQRVKRCPVAVVRLGLPHTLRRFEAGREVKP
jgi:hypothetical protein